MSADPVSLPQGDQWKNVDAVQAWKAGRRKSLEKKWGSKWAPPLLSGIVQAAIRQEDPDFAIARELVQWDEETLAHRARRLENEGRQRKPLKPKGGCRHTPPAMLAKDGDVWLVSPIGRRATPAKLAKSKAMWDRNLHAKAERELACGLLGGPVECKNGHRFRTDYECGNRYCAGGCGKKAATRLFAKHKDRLFFVATRLLMCRGSDSWGNGCDECSQAIEEKRLPHWLPPKGKKPRVVLATIDFTLINTGHAGPDLMRLLNHYIKKFARAIEKPERFEVLESAKNAQFKDRPRVVRGGLTKDEARAAVKNLRHTYGAYGLKFESRRENGAGFGIRRSEYGLAYCDELGANNTNAHAHGIYVGPWLPQESKQLSRLWKEITGGSFIIHIKYAENFHRALFHAVKYPAKFVDRSTPERLAELERIFHRVRRFHTLASFYAPEAPEERAPEVRKCPICEAPLLKMGPWEPIAAMARRGLKNLATVKAEMERERGPTGAGPPALINHTAERAAGSDSQSAAF